MGNSVVDQYMKVKSDNPDSIVMVRMGDYIELFGDDAVATAKAFNLVITSRRERGREPVPSTGFARRGLRGAIEHFARQNQKVVVFWWEANGDLV